MKFFRIIIFSVAAFVVSVGCSKKASKSTASIKISSQSLQGFSAFPSDQRICFGFDISADDIKFEESTNCSPKKSLHGGFIESGGTLKAEVPQGEKRQIDLYAYLLPNGDETSECPAWDEDIDYSSVYKVGGTPEPLDLFDVKVEVPIEALFPGLASDIKSVLGLTSCDDGTVPVDGITNIQINSDNADSLLASPGDTITLTFQSDYPLDELSVLIFGTSASLSDLGGGNYQVTYLISGSEAEGSVPFVIQHTSGNVTTTTDGTVVNFDKTAPTAPTAISKLTPSYVMGTDVSPTFSITGTETGALVELFTDSSCTVLVGSATAASTVTTVAATGLTLGVMNDFYARVVDPAGNASACSTVFDRYATFSNHPFISTWQTTVPGETITLPLRGGFTYNFLVDWGDGTTSFITSDVDPDRIHTFVTPGTHTIVFGGVAETLYFNNTGDRDKIFTVQDLGDMGWTSFENMFDGCTNLTTFNGSSHTSGVTNMRSTFQGATNVNPDVSAWDTSAVTNMIGMFWMALNANPDVSTWDTSSVTSMASMFRDATNANPDVSAWDTSAVTNMTAMFQNVTTADPDVSAWDTSSVTSMMQMFYGSNANPDVSGWNVSNVTNFSGMFAYATLANPVVTAWDVSGANDMSTMFIGASNANPNVMTWDVSYVTNMSGMFASNLAATPDTSLWNVSSVSNFSGMFNLATNANPDVSSWDTSAATDMSSIFWGASNATPDVSGWDTSNVSDMWSMFRDATSADPDMSAWNFSSVTDMDLMFNGTTISTANYANLLVALSVQIPAANLTLDGGGAQYGSPGVAAHTTLTSTNSWVITDGGY